MSRVECGMGGTVYVPGFGGALAPPRFVTAWFPAPCVSVDYGGCVERAEFLARIHEAIEAHRPSVVVGHSVGGYLALDALAERDHPSVKRVVAAGIGTRVEPGPVLRAVVRLPTALVYVFLALYLLAAPYFFLIEGRAARQRFGLVENLRRLGVGTAARSCRRTLFTLRVAAPPRGAPAVELVALRRDVLIAASDVARAAALLPGATVRWLDAPDAIHLTADVMDRLYTPDAPAC